MSGNGLEMSNQLRSDWVDHAKAIGIILVVYGHAARGIRSAGLPVDHTVFLLVDSVIYSFHMQLFFFLSGLFFASGLTRRGAAGTFANRVDTLVYPYILWSLVQGLIEVGVSRHTNAAVTIGQVFTLWWAPRAQFWFLYALFFVSLAGIAIYSVARSNRPYAAVALLAAIPLAVGGYATNLIPLNFTLTYLLYFALGVWFNPWSGRAERHAALALVPLVLVACAAQFVFHGYLGLRYTAAGAAGVIVATASICAVVALSMVSARYRLTWLSTLGVGSMAIYLMHILAASGTRIILVKALGLSDVAVHLVVGTCAGLLAPLLVIRLLPAAWGAALLAAPPALSAQRLLTAVRPRSV
jgi:fucose 4-O-acetylase-like acetyltransferase